MWFRSMRLFDFLAAGHADDLAYLPKEVDIKVVAQGNNGLDAVMLVKDPDPDRSSPTCRCEDWAGSALSRSWSTQNSHAVDGLRRFVCLIRSGEPSRSRPSITRSSLSTKKRVAGLQPRPNPAPAALRAVLRR